MRKLTIVIKLGTSSIVSEKDHSPLLAILAAIVETVVNLRKDGHRVILVSSGAIGMALQRMKLNRRPRNLPKVQALAAIGQSHLMTLWESLFNHVDQPVAQILLTRNDIADRSQWQNAQNTLQALLDMHVVPIVNENDTLSVAEIKFGDNDTLSAITAGMVHADYLFLMTDVPCLYDKNPRDHPDAVPIEVVEDAGALSRSIDTSTSGSSLGTGGMETKLIAARLATSGGVTTVITKSSDPENIIRIVEHVEKTKEPTTEVQPSAFENAETDAVHPPHPISTLDAAIELPPRHTRFTPAPNPMRDRYFWILHGLNPHGTIFIDEGAYRALEDGANLLPVGIVDVEGWFSQQDAVNLCVVRRIKERVESTGMDVSTTTPPGSPTPLEPVKVPDSPPTPSRTGTSSPRSNRSSSPRLRKASLPHTPPPESYEILSDPSTETLRALVNYSAAEIRQIKGLQTKDVEDILGYALSEYVALRENIAFLRTNNGVGDGSAA